jgi:hypothetical protein
VLARRHSFLSITAVAVGDGEPVTTASPVVGFAAFFDAPVGAEVSAGVDAEEWTAWARASFGLDTVQVTCPASQLL